MVAEPLRGGVQAPGEPGVVAQPQPDGSASPRRPAGPVERPALEGRPPWALMYHSVDSGPQDPYLLTVSPQRFAAQLGWLRRRGLRGVSMRELVRAYEQQAADGLVGLTFDDGYADFPRQVLPLLRAHGFTATLYVVAGRMGGHNAWDADAPRKPLVTIDQVRQLADAGVEIGSHGLSHCRMTGLAADELTTETRRSREALESVVRGPVTGFCYPYGAVDEAAEQAVAAAGYDYGAGICHQSATSRWALPRCYVGERDGGLRLSAKRVRHALRGWSA
ncbi:polysaccharide deacetylase family protein [Streptacidiphilus jiangxiensis]|uniref:Polysaccharide deacetylase n=1 Tax=Streptacidiphilus jiangxiensis TaxID=235985 RepID=A0A1H7VQK6_STRJI|nr:polysaccharide deacetylase family protein [Streptacidiphilus jiangxiensis]SEM11553.1 Polysaccharide deacetylase [Streptacidiphilus jiangxiensis]